jgi:hypothetical protein
MGGFIVVKREQRNDLENTEKQHQDSLNVFAKKGLPLNKKIITSDHIIYVFNKYQPKDNNTLLFDNGDFIIATGTMIYNRQTGPNALKALFQDFSVTRQEFLSRILGNYGLIIYKEKKLFVSNSPIGLYRVYCDQSKKFISSSLLAVLKLLKSWSIQDQELYEYFFDGAFYGDKTLIKEIDLFNTRTIYQLTPEVTNIPKVLKFRRLKSGSLNEMAQEACSDLIDYNKIIQSNFGNSVCAALTGGLDTRLMLGFLRKAGIEPYLYVYGDKNSVDIRIARMVAEGEGLKLDVEEKTKFPQMKKDDYPDFLEKQFNIVDGLGNYGIFDNGSDMITRIKRIQKGQLQLNGACYGVQRPWYAVPDRPLSINSLIKAKHDRGDYSMCRNFNKSEYFINLGKKIKQILNIDRDWVERRESEMLTVDLRTKYWTGFNHMINNQLADALVPCEDPQFIYMTIDVPFKYRYLGVLQAAMLNLVDPALAKYTSQYGFSYSDYDKIPSKVKLKNYLQFHTPTRLIPYIRAHYWEQEHKGHLPYYLKKEYLDTIFPSSDFEMQKYVDIDKISDPSMLSRVLSAELLLTNRF